MKPPSFLAFSLSLLLIFAGCNRGNEETSPLSNEDDLPTAEVGNQDPKLDPGQTAEDEMDQSDEQSIEIYYVLFLQDEKIDEKALFLKCSDDNIAILDSADAGGTTAGVYLKRDLIKDRPLPPDSSLAYFGRGFSEASMEQLKKSRIAISLTGVGPFDPEHGLLRDLTRCVGKMANALDAFVFDAADSLTFTPAAFHEIRVAEIERGELSASQFGVRAYRVEGGIRSVTMGLEKFGQTNLGIAFFSEHHMPAIDLMMTLAIQHVIESASPVTEGPLELDVRRLRVETVRKRMEANVRSSGTGKATMNLKPLASLGGDPHTLLAPSFKAPPGESLWAELAVMLEQLFGAARHVSENVPLKNLEQAMQQARQEALTILRDAKKWSAAGRRFRVAVELPVVQEIVWVEVESWENSKGQGILLSAPSHVKDLKSGSSFTFAGEMIVDYILSDGEGVIEQGGIDDLVRALESER